MLYHRLPGQAAIAAERSRLELRPLASVEVEVIGFSHAEVGAKLMRKWGLPENIVAVVGDHHDPVAQGEHKLGVAIVRLAELLAYSLDEACLGIGYREGVAISDWEQIGSRDSARDSVIAEARAQFAAAHQAMFG